METYSLLVVILLASLGFLAFAAKVALVTEIAFLLVVAYLAVFVALAALLAVAVCRVVSLYDKIAQGERRLNSCQTDASAKQQSAASRIDALEHDIAENKKAFAKEWRDRNSRSQKISALKETHSQEIARLQAILVKVKSESVDSSEVEIAKRIERQWSLLRHVLVKRGIKATTEQEWLDAVTELVQRKPSNSTPIGVVSEDLETARAQLAKEIHGKETAELKATRLEASLRVAQIDVNILKNDLQETEAKNDSEQRHMDLQRQQLDAEQQKEWGGKEKTRKLQRQLAGVWQQLRKEQSRFQKATENLQAARHIINQHDKEINQRDEVIKNLRNDIVNTNTQKEELQKKLDGSHVTEEQKGKDLVRAQRRIEEQEAEISKLQSHNDKAAETTKSLSNELGSTRNELISAQSTIMQQASEISGMYQLEDKLQKANSSLEEAHQIIATGNGYLTHARKAYHDEAMASAEKNGQILNLTATLESTQASLTQCEAEKAQLQTQLNNVAMPPPLGLMSDEELDDLMKQCARDGQQYGSNFNLDENISDNTAPQFSATNNNLTQDLSSGGASSSQQDFSDLINNDLADGFELSSLDTIDVSDTDFSGLADFNNSTSWPGQGQAVDSTAQPSQDTSQYVDFSQLYLGDDMTNTTLVNDEFVYNDPNFQPYSTEELTATPQDLPTYTTHESEYDTGNNNNDQSNSSYALPEPQGRKRRAS